MIEMFDCPHDKHGLKISQAGCGKVHKRVAALAKEKKKLEQGPLNLDGSKKTLAHPDMCFFDLHKACLKCKIGMENMENLKAEFKECPCGKEFFRKEGEAWRTWCIRKYCPEHAAMSPYQREKEFEGLGLIRDKKPTGTQPDPARTKQVEPEKQKPEEVIVLPTETKTCEWEKCGKEIVRRPDDTGWSNRKYCYDTDCARKAEQKRDNLRRKQIRKAAKRKIEFNLDTATEIAREVTEDYVSLFASLVDTDVKELDRIKVLSTRVGIECQKKAIKRACA